MCQGMCKLEYLMKEIKFELNPEDYKGVSVKVILFKRNKSKSREA